MRKIKQGKCDYDYVELMACPSGCINGGGQIKLNQYQEVHGNETVKINQDLVKIVGEIYHDLEKDGLDLDLELIQKLTADVQEICR